MNVLYCGKNPYSVVYNSISDLTYLWSRYSRIRVFPMVCALTFQWWISAHVSHSNMFPIGQFSTSPKDGSQTWDLSPPVSRAPNGEKHRNSNPCSFEHSAVERSGAIKMSPRFWEWRCFSVNSSQQSNGNKTTNRLWKRATLETRWKGGYGFICARCPNANRLFSVVVFLKSKKTARLFSKRILLKKPCRLDHVSS